MGRFSLIVIRDWLFEKMKVKGHCERGSRAAIPIARYSLIVENAALKC